MITRRWVEWAPKWALRLFRREEETVELNFTAALKHDTVSHQDLCLSHWGRPAHAGRRITHEAAATYC